MNWIIPQVVACIFVTIANTLFTIRGLSISSYCVNSLFILCSVYLFGISYSNAPSFFQPWFLGSSCLAVFGFIVSLFLDSGLSFIRWLGMVLVIIGAYCLIK